ncbi:MAG: hypothetical protein M9927_03825 [Anaerolineae bacterium]|nr:hypothetical protein [Anaerolineae bacterium]
MSHIPKYPSGVYVSVDGRESVTLVEDNGVQAQHTRATFLHDSGLPGAQDSPVVKTAEIPIDSDLAYRMKQQIETQTAAKFQFIDYSSLEKSSRHSRRQFKKALRGRSPVLVWWSGRQRRQVTMEGKASSGTTLSPFPYQILTEVFLLLLSFVNSRCFRRSCYIMQ